MVPKERIFLNREEIKNKITASWIGKNIGGTIGAPFEGKTEVQNVTGFTSPKGEPLPNDDLDLQLVWLFAMEKEGPFRFSARRLGEYWLMMIPPDYNEYGIGKANVCEGIVAPLSGELHNDKWRNSNGAWIRSEIWAALAPGYPAIARKYAFEDAAIDHGFGEGTYAEQFTATLESLAYVISDRRTLIEQGLAAIPADSRVAAAVRLVLREYDKGTPYLEVREMLVEQSADIGFFQAPANLGFVTIGLLYGEGDFKKSVLYAVNCGDDTDCTGATVGAILGIIGGTAGIPKDWAEYIGERIVTICINGHYSPRLPSSCTELTERVMQLSPTVFLANGIIMEYTDGETSLPEDFLRERTPHECFEGYRGASVGELCEKPRYSFEVERTPYAEVYGSFDRIPAIHPGESLTLTLHVKNICARAYHLRFEAFLPEGWTACFDTKNLGLSAHWAGSDAGKVTVTVTAGERVDALNHIYLIARPTGLSTPIFADFAIEG